MDAGGEKKLDDLCREYGVDLGAAMKKARVRKGLTQKQLADAAGLSANTIGNFERNRTKIPAYIVKVYCDVLDVSADELLKTGREFYMKGKAKAVAVELPDLPDQYLDGLLDMIRTHKKGTMIKPKDDGI